jgi:hypothetical protein
MSKRKLLQLVQEILLVVGMIQECLLFRIRRRALQQAPSVNSADNMLPKEKTMIIPLLEFCLCEDLKTKQSQELWPCWKPTVNNYKSRR